MDVIVDITITADIALTLHHNTKLYNNEICSLMNYYGSAISTDYLDECTAHELFDEMWRCGMCSDTTLTLRKVDSYTIKRLMEMLEDYNIVDVCIKDLFRKVVNVMVEEGEWHKFVCSAPKKSRK